MKKYIGIGLAFLALAGSYIFYQTHYTKIQSIAIESEKIAETTKIVQITDFHNCSILNLKGLIKEIQDFKPDGIAITGDIITKKERTFEKTKDLVQKLEVLEIPIFYVYGNHEVYNTELEPQLTDYLLKHKVEILHNRNVGWPDKNIKIIGTGDAYTYTDNLDEAMKGITEKTFNLMLSHSPNIIEREGLTAIDLIICGHTHGGQIRVPLVGSLIAPGQGWFPEYDQGLFEIGESKLYIDSGIGFSGPPIRTFNQSQITFITLKAGDVKARKK